MKNMPYIMTILSFFAYYGIFSQEQQKDTWITVYVHGIMSIKPHISMDNFMLFMKDKIDHTVYSKTVENMRMDPYFYLNQAMQGFGLLPLDINHIEKNCAPNAIARIYDEATKASNDTDINNYYYSFGWSGLMSSSHRYQEAEHFFQILEHEVKLFKEKGITPKIRLIGYSHGGNICLNLGAIRRDIYPQSTLSIDELILLGVPIQTETDYLVADPLFKKIYNIYSTHDRIQQIDLFSFNRVLSRKNFASRHDFTLPDNLIQIELKIRRFRKTKSSAKRQHWQSVDLNNDLFVSGNASYLRNSSPGHIELWFFGWTPQHYRSNFIIAPIPVLVILPFVFHAVEKNYQMMDKNNIIIVDIRPEQELMLIKQYKPKKFVAIEPFMSKSFHKQMSDIAHKVEPDEFSNEQYNEHIRNAYNHAVIYQAENKPEIVGRKPHKPKRSRKRSHHRRKKKEKKIKSILSIA